MQNGEQTDSTSTREEAIAWSANQWDGHQTMQAQAAKLPHSVEERSNIVEQGQSGWTSDGQQTDSTSTPEEATAWSGNQWDGHQTMQNGEQTDSTSTREEAIAWSANQWDGHQTMQAQAA